MDNCQQVRSAADVLVVTLILGIWVKKSIQGQHLLVEIKLWALTWSLTLLSFFLCWIFRHRHNTRPAITQALCLFAVSFSYQSASTLYHFLLPLTATWPHHSAPRSWHERDFCLMNLPASRSRGYRGTKLDRKRLAREVMLSRWPPPIMSSALVPGGQGGWPRASRTAHSSSSGVRWSRDAEISRYRQL